MNNLKIFKQNGEMVLNIIKKDTIDIIFSLNENFYIAMQDIIKNGIKCTLHEKGININADKNREDFLYEVEKYFKFSYNYKTKLL